MMSRTQHLDNDEHRIRARMRIVLNEWQAKEMLKEVKEDKDTAVVMNEDEEYHVVTNQEQEDDVYV